VSPRIEIVWATPAHAAELAPRLRPADVAELWAETHHVPAVALERGRAASRWAWAVLCDGVVAALFGVQPADGHWRIWMLGSELIPRHARAFLRTSRAIVTILTARCTRVHGFVDTRYDGATRWLRWLGFRLGPAAPRGLDRVPFRSFSKEGA
jgi:hypothetical protein